MVVGPCACRNLSCVPLLLSLNTLKTHSDLYAYKPSQRYVSHLSKRMAMGNANHLMTSTRRHRFSCKDGWLALSSACPRRWTSRTIFDACFRVSAYRRLTTYPDLPSCWNRFRGGSPLVDHPGTQHLQLALSAITDAYGKNAEHVDKMRGCAKVVQVMLRTWSGKRLITSVVYDEGDLAQGLCIIAWTTCARFVQLLIPYVYLLLKLGCIISPSWSFGPNGFRRT